jgi:hypothetical protein
MITKIRISGTKEAMAEPAPGSAGSLGIGGGHEHRDLQQRARGNRADDIGKGPQAAAGAPVQAPM